MLQDKYHILSTRPLTHSAIINAEKNSIQIDVKKFFVIKPLLSPELLNNLSTAVNRTMVFTSANAVAILQQHYLRNWPKNQWHDPQICCISGKTKQAILQTFPSAVIQAEAPYGLALATAIIQRQSIHEISFFCSNKRRNELPETLKKADITVHEYTIYENIATPVASADNYNGILFFSPSAVESYFSVNKLSPDTVCFAIGSTTATTLEKHTNNKIILSNSPSEDSMIQAAIFYFNNINCYE